MSQAVKNTAGIATLISATALFIALHSWMYIQ